MASSDPIRAVRVERVTPLGPTMRRVTFAPEGDPQPTDKRPHGGHCRLFFPDPQDAAVSRSRTFTYRHWHADGRFDVDFVVQDGDGPAARWLRRAAPGYALSWCHGGPPKVTLMKPGARESFLVADATALPLVSALLETAHATRPIHVLLLPDARGPLPRIYPSKPVEIRRCCTIEDIEARLRRSCRPGSMVLAACEADSMRRLRRLVLNEIGLDPGHVFTSGYWKAGLRAEDVDVAKRSRAWFGDPLPPRMRHALDGADIASAQVSE
jgi:NADPH-dependent ferric siderophore reductase